MIFSLLPVDIWRRNYNIFQFIGQFIFTAQKEIRLKDKSEFGEVIYGLYN